MGSKSIEKKETLMSLICHVLLDVLSFLWYRKLDQKEVERSAASFS